MTQLMTATIKVVMYTAALICAVLAVRNILLDHALEAVIQTIVCFVAWGNAKTTGDGTDD